MTRAFLPDYREMCAAGGSGCSGYDVALEKLMENLEAPPPTWVYPCARLEQI